MSISISPLFETTSCPGCRKKTDKSRALATRRNRFICCSCGQELSSKNCQKGPALSRSPIAVVRLPPQIVSILQTLLQRPDFYSDGKISVQPDSNGDLHTLQIFFPSLYTPFATGSDWSINLQWQMRNGCKGCDGAPDRRPAARAAVAVAVAEYVPDLIHQLTQELVAQFSEDGGSTVLTPVTLSEPLKSLRVEHKNDASKTSRAKRMSICAEVNWASAGLGKGYIFVPTRHRELALDLLTTRVEMRKKHWGRLNMGFFFNRRDFEQYPPIKPLYFVKIACDLSAIAGALIDVGTVKVGPGSLHGSVERWFDLHSRLLGSQGFPFSEAVDRVIDYLPHEAFSLHYLPGTAVTPG